MRNSKTRLVFGTQKHSEENKRDINQAKPQQNIGFLSERVPRRNLVFCGPVSGESICKNLWRTRQASGTELFPLPDARESLKKKEEL